MFNMLDEQQYREIVKYANAIYQNEVIGIYFVAPQHRNLEIDKLRINAAYAKYKKFFDSNEKAILFRLNLLVSNNVSFAQIFLDACSNYLQTTNIKTITRLFSTNTPYKQEERNKIIYDITKLFSLNEKATEINFFYLHTICLRYNYFINMLSPKEKKRYSS